MKITISQPKIILDIIKTIQKRLEISPENDRVLFFAPDEFRTEDDDIIRKRDLKNALRKLSEDEKVIKLKDIQCLDRLGWRSGEKIELEINREVFSKIGKSAKESIKKKIKHIALDPKSFSLIINHQDYVPFRSKRHKQDLEAETKQFKILYHLWEFRKEIKNGKINQKIDSDFASLSNIARGAECTEEAARQHIKRLRQRFRKEKLPIDIEPSGTGLYQLVIELE